MLNIWNDILGMLQAPFVGPIDLAHLFLIVGVVLIFIFLWIMIVNHVRLAAHEVL